MALGIRELSLWIIRMIIIVLVSSLKKSALVAQPGRAKVS